MEFGPLPLDHALGAYLAHSTGPLRKGKLLTAADIATLRAAGLTEVIAARLGPGDLHEDTAATRIAAALITSAQGLRAGAAGTGRVNLYATGPGVLVLDVAALHAANRVHPMLTIATVPPFQRLTGNEMAATVKIISYGVPAAAVDEAARLATAAMTLATPRYTTATLIETTTTSDTPNPKGREALTARLNRLGLTLTPRLITPHRSPEIAAALASAPGEVLFILTTSATSDPNDVAPHALRLAGGQVTRFGMPVDPGNLLFHGTLGAKPVIGLPGCARSPALNGADWVLERLICGIEVSADDIAVMGVGGLLKEIPQRGRLRES